MLVLLCHLQLGYAAAWVGTPAPLFWIWQKMTFVLGGLMIPLTLYPAPSEAWPRPRPSPPWSSPRRPSCSMPRRGRSSATLALQLLWLAVIGMPTLLVARAAAARFAEHGI